MSSNYASKVIEIAKNEVGYLEKSASAYKKDRTVLMQKTKGAGSDNYTKYGKFMGESYVNAYWCASFVSYCFDVAYGSENGKKLMLMYSASCESIRQTFVKNKQYDKKPKVGDLIFFSGTRHSGANHIGIVYKVDSKTVYTIEGNTTGATEVIDNGGAVAKKSYDLSNSRILGYGHPKYDKEKSTKANASPLYATVNTKASPLCVRNEKGVKVGSLSKGTRVKIVKRKSVKMKIGLTKTYMTTIIYNGVNMYVADKYLKY